MKAFAAAFVLASPWWLLRGEATRPVPHRRGAASLLQKTQAVSAHRGTAVQQQKEEEGRQRGEGMQQARKAKWRPWGCFWAWPFCSSPPPVEQPATGSYASPEEVKEALEKAAEPKPSDLTDPDKMEDMANHMEGQLAAKLAAGTLGSIGVHHNANGQCEVDLVTKAVGKQYDYVCDTTVPWLHYAKDSTWAQATPPAGTGCHSYVFLTGDVPEGCSVGASCPECGSPYGTVVHTVKIEGGSCKSPC